MPAPTRGQITATIALPTYLAEINTGSGYVTISGAEIFSIDTKLQTTNNIDNAFAFGTISTAEASVQATDAITVSSWQQAKLRISYGFDTSTKVVAFEGVVIKRQHQGRYYIYEARGFDYLIEREKIYTSVFYRRPIATETTATSVEDITSGVYAGGLLNYTMWQAGGRPFEQPSYASDPAFKFWYSFDQSIVAPRYSWLSGENAWDEVHKLVRAAGGQLYQDRDGVIYYKQPLTFGYVASGSTLYEFTEATYQTITEEASTVENMDVVKASYVERVLQPMTIVYESTTPTLLPSGNTQLQLEMQYPVYQYANYLTAGSFISNKSAVKATFFDGTDATTNANFTVSFTTISAQLVELTFTNRTGAPISLNKLVIQGRPIGAGSEGLASYTNGTGSELQLEDNIYVQSFPQAYRLTRMVYDFYHTNRAMITLDGVGYDPDRFLGEVVELTYAAWGLSHARHRIIALEYKNGAKMAVTLAPITGLVTRNDVFVVGTTYVSGDTRMVSY